MGVVTTWEIVEIKHKYIHALHDIIQNFQTRFPDQRALYRFSFADGDIKPALEQIRSVAESNSEIAGLYNSSNVPLSCLASLVNHSSISFASYMQAIGMEIVTCAGNVRERLRALALIRQRRSGGAVLDAYTAWVAASLGVLDVLILTFGELRVAQSVVDEINALISLETMDRRARMTIGWEGGRFVKREYSLEEIDANIENTKRLIEFVMRDCCVCPTQAPDTPSVLAADVTRCPGPTCCTSRSLSAERGILISEDLRYRSVAKLAGGVEASGFRSSSPSPVRRA